MTEKERGMNEKEREVEAKLLSSMYNILLKNDNRDTVRIKTICKSNLDWK